ncbi:MAG: toll/interleukin-1 receptor domain-containing protein [Ruminococcus sp.]|jgi:hypothetical protein
MRNKIFLSYSHADALYKSNLETHLTALKHYFNVQIWNDSQLVVGEEWERQIEQVIGETAVAILLISKDYLASEFIAKKEVAPILEALEKKKIRIIPVILTHCLFSKIDALSKYQAVNDPKRPLCSMSESEQDQVWVEVASLAWEELKKTAEPVQEAEAPAAKERKLTWREQESVGKMNAALHGMLVPDSEGWYFGSIAAIRENVREDFRCYRLNQLLYDPAVNGDCRIEKGESHWLFYKTGQFHDLQVGDKVIFKIDKLNELRHWKDLKNTRNIYIRELYVSAKKA